MNNYTFVGEIDVSEIEKILIHHGEEAWKKDTTRQILFHAHRFTQTIPILWDLQSLSENKVGERREYYEDYNLSTFSKNLEKILENFYGRGNIVRILITKLKAKKQIDPHIDSGIGLELSKRIHIPIITNKNVFFYVGSEKKHMKKGEMWEINNQKVHYVKNDSDEDRVHLIVDYSPQNFLINK